MRGTVPSRTILAQNGQQGMPASHPLFYTQQRSKYLQRLAGQSAIESDLPTNDLRRNMRIDHYLNQYNHVRSKLEKQARIKNSMLKTTQFNSLFAQQQMDRRGKERQKKEVRSMQEELYQNYVQNPQVYRPAERDYVEQIEGPQTVLEMGGGRRKQLYLLDLEIDRLKREDKITKTVQYKHQTCRNNQLLGRLSSTLFSSYLVHFEQIVGLLLDQMLEDEVIHLNYLEAQYKMAPYQKQPPSRKTVQMAELVRALDDLCDE